MKPVVYRTIKPLNGPQQVSVQTDAAGQPASIRIETGMAGPATHQRNRSSRHGRARQELRAIRSDGRWMTVSAIEDIWKINDEWWRGEGQEIERVYFDVVLESNQRLIVFYDLVRDEWFRQAD
jgi:hypothetical protein